MRTIWRRGDQTCSPLPLQKPANTPPLSSTKIAPHGTTLGHQGTQGGLPCAAASRPSTSVRAAWRCWPASPARLVRAACALGQQAAHQGCGLLLSADAPCARWPALLACDASIGALARTSQPRLGLVRMLATMLYQMPLALGFLGAFRC